MKSQTRTTTAFVAAGLLAAAAFAQPLHAADEATPETTAAAKRLMTVMEVQKQMAPMWKSMKGMQDAMLDRQNLSEEQKNQAREVMAASMGEIEKALAWENMEPMIIRVYASTFTAGEMDKLSDFFESPGGRVYIAKQPQLQKAMMAEIQTIMTGLMPKIQKKTEEVVERIKNGESPTPK